MHQRLMMGGRYTVQGACLTSSLLDWRICLAKLLFLFSHSDLICPVTCRQCAHAHIKGVLP